MKYTLFAFLIFIAFNSCNPRMPWWGFEKEYCGTKVVIENGGCSPCFIIATNKPLKTPNWISSIPGCRLSYRVSTYTYSFSIDEPFDVNDAMNKIKKRLQENYCKD